MSSASPRIAATASSSPPARSPPCRPGPTGPRSSPSSDVPEGAGGIDDLPSWLTASGLIGAIAFGLLSAFFPPLNAEVYALAAPVIFPDQWVLHISAMTAGLVVGKVSHFVAAAKGAEAVSRRRAREDAPRRPKGPVRARLARWSAAMLGVLDRPRLGPLVVLASSGVGFPPLAVVTVAAGLRRLPLTMFVSVTTIGCLARFLVTGLVVAIAAG